MINAIKKINPIVLSLLTGVAVWFSMLNYTFSILGAMAIMTGSNFVSMLVVVSLFTVAIFALISRLLIRLSFRIVGGIFTRKSGMLYPFPIRYGEFTGVILAFAFLCFMICGLISLPLLFLPTLASVLGAVRSVVTWGFLFLGARYFVNNYSHDYDKKALATSLSVIPFVLIGLNLVLTIWEVVA